MCFPSKWLKKNFSDEDKPKAVSSKPTKATEKSPPNGTKATEKSRANDTTVSSKGQPKPLKTAIVIYTMYGHIASRESRRSPRDPSVDVTNLHQLRNLLRLELNLRVETRQSTSELLSTCVLRLGQYSSCSSGFPRPSRKMSWG